MKRTKISPALSFLILLLILALISGCFSYFASKFGTTAQKAQGTPQKKAYTVVLDAGHGGEDGGTVSADGILEKDLNLRIAMLVKDLLEANGTPVVMTRETDTLLYDKNVDYEGKKKALDLAARREIGEKIPDAVFVSIHMNAYPSEQYNGLQVWYSPNHESSFFLAKNLQSTAKLHLQPENTRQVKSATSRIYLLHHLTCPAVLVECGFLSNPTEATRLSTDEYQHQLALVIFHAITEWCNGT